MDPVTSLPWDRLVARLRSHDLLVAAPAEGPAVTGVVDDSRTVESGALFCAVRGWETDGHQFLDDAISRGAAAVVVEDNGTSAVPAMVVRDSRAAARLLASLWYHDPASAMTLLGVTGTNGKTTTVALTRHLLNDSGSCGSIGTLGAVDGNGQLVASTAGQLTTPGAVDLQATLARLRGRQVDTVVMETSSHSLDQGRLDGLNFSVAVFTNLTRDHLDYHPSMADYRAAKLRLLSYLGQRGRATAVVNADDPAWQDVTAPDMIRVGRDPSADLRIGEVLFDAAGSTFAVDGRLGQALVRLPLLGEFNVSNASQALAAAVASGRGLVESAERLAEAPQVPGRMEVLHAGRFTVLRDYAHTPDALLRALTTLRPLTRERLIVVFGCGGDRDRGKRPEMGEVAARHSDLPVATSDNPRTEDPEEILDDVERGMGQSNFLRHPDRRAAIRLALEQAGEGDTVLLAGKGHEDYQIIGREKIPFDEALIVREELGDGLD